MKIRIITLVILILEVVCMPLHAQNFFVRNFTVEEYHGGTQNWAVDFGADECLYFGNNFGLMTYDGSRWEVNQVRNYTAVRSVLAEEDVNRIYVGASDEFGYFSYDNKNYKTVYTSLSAKLPSNEGAITEIWRIFKWNGNTVFQGHHSIFLFAGDKFMRAIHMKDRIETSAIINDKLVMVSRKELFVYEAKGAQKTYALDNNINDCAIRELLPIKGNIMLCSPEKGFVVFDGTSFTPLRTTIDSELANSKIFSVALDDDILAIGTVRNGLYLYNINNHSVNHINVSSGLGNNTVLSIAFDNSSNIWLCLDNGIALLQPHSAFQQLIPYGHSIGTGCASAIYDGMLYLGTNQGLFYTNPPYDGGTGTVPQSVMAIKGQVWSLCNDDGTLLCGADDGAYTVKGSVARKIDNTDGTWKLCSLKHHPGYIIASDYTGLYILHRRNGVYNLHARLSDCDIVSNNIIEDNDGSIWICHWQKGIYHITLDESLTKTTSKVRFHKGNGLVVDQGNNIGVINGRVVISSVDGLHTFNGKTGKLEKSGTLTSLFNTYDNSLQIFQTPEGDVWGLKQSFMAIAHAPDNPSHLDEFRVDRTSFLGVLNLLQLGLGNITTINSKYTLFSGKDGYYIVDNDYENTSDDSNVYIRKIFSTNNSDSLLYSYHVTDENMKIVIPHRNNSLRIEFIMPEYRATENVVYSCYLENYDNDWTAEQKASFKEYTQLSKGKYVFHVKARNLINGLEKEDIISFEIEAAWYETYFAYAVYMLLFIAFIYIIIHSTRRRNESAMQREREKQQQQLTEIKSQNLEMQLKLKSHELASSTMSLVRKNDILQEIDEEMKKLSESVRREEAKADITHRINNIRKGLKMNINDDANWDKFEESFNLIYDNLMQRLCKVYPDLKMNDRRLCAYLRMGLNSKEIASLMNTTTRSIETARYRLRKKLQLSAGENLSDFLLNY